MTLSKAGTRAAQRPRVRLLSYNIQVGLATRHYGEYVTGAWRHALPSGGHRDSLARIAEPMRDYDFVAVQEADAGSLRTRFLNQMEYLAEAGGFPHWGFTVTRDLRPVAQHCLGYLSRLPVVDVREHVLPSVIPGRRALQVELAVGERSMTALVAHLSLGAAAQRRQLNFLSELLADRAPAVLLGDLNCEPAVLRAHPALRRLRLSGYEHTPPTFPSWKPVRSIDHILVSPGVTVLSLAALRHAVSDHLPLAAEIELQEL
jgi:endonuclease/exonuclease/phosphatase family metal-dependent hydrolase